MANDRFVGGDSKREALQEVVSLLLRLLRERGQQRDFEHFHSVRKIRQRAAFRQLISSHWSLLS
ncbi:hypothetical protein C3Z06_04740 [Cupriavidus metallidurans]|nr:hypothetical protein C3Z06_04740 [Cupriavidus metallidurans]